MADFINIFITPKEGVTQEKVEEKINLGIDWFRYHKNCYVVYTTSDMEKWQVRLKPLVEPDGRLFICEINPAIRNGWMTIDFWEWLDKKR